MADGTVSEQRDSTSTLAEPVRASMRARVGVGLGPLLAVATYLLLPADSDGLTPEGRAVAAVGVLMAVWWVCESLPLAATALLPIVCFPLLGVSTVREATTPYANDIIFLLMGGMILGLAMQRWNLHRRIALRTILTVGTSPIYVIGGFMAATGFLSMWVSNTATTLMMLPIALSLITTVFQHFRSTENGYGDSNPVDDRDGRTFAVCLVLSIAYAASIGSLGTLIGTPPNAIMAAFLNDNHGISIGFGQWMAMGVPLAVVFLVVAWFMLTRVIFRIKLPSIPGGRALFQRELRELGPLSRGERTVLVVFACTAAAWVLREPITNWGWLTSHAPGIGNLSDTGIAIAAALALFFIPVDARRGVFAMDWATAVRLPWGMLLLFGGGLSLAAGIRSSGLDKWIGAQATALGDAPTVVLVLVVIAAVLLLTEVTSNTATATTFLPILAAAAIGTGSDVLLLVVPATLAASCAFMLPMATAPNALAFGSGYVTMPQMVRAGWWLNLVAIVLIQLTIYALGTWTLGIRL
ncbi:di- and tricarboxylate transporter [Longimycelium tulufanense]|uniref:Sodium-dependent dicarboxylate transporter SdcS n=1 Tax=Longimycelium tulufanense TaxID=907463 RepID=A0A8J3FUW2_9PSEU|nr:DASS family sodium-coupled anion symporter [Longimycelium tulufanense]GGM53433.1 di- and tricarboxylate transporter [Longimycelium tulufanense]